MIKVTLGQSVETNGLSLHGQGRQTLLAKRSLTLGLCIMGILLMVGQGMTKTALPKNVEETMEGRMKTALQQYVAERLLLDPDTIDVQNINPVLPFSAGRITVTQNQRTENQGLVGRSLFSIGMIAPDGQEHQQWVSADVSVVRTIWVAARLISRGEPLTPDAVSREKFYQTRLEEPYLDADLPLGNKRASRAILPGEPLMPNRIEDISVIARGERVTLVAERDGIRITTEGRAKEKGFIGKTLAVAPKGSNKIVYGTVVDAQTVRVSF